MDSTSRKRQSGSSASGARPQLALATARQAAGRVCCCARALMLLLSRGLQPPLAEKKAAKESGTGWKHLQLGHPVSDIVRCGKSGYVCLIRATHFPNSAFQASRIQSKPHLWRNYEAGVPKVAKLKELGPQ